MLYVCVCNGDDVKVGVYIVADVGIWVGVYVVVVVIGVGGFVDGLEWEILFKEEGAGRDGGIFVMVEEGFVFVVAWSIAIDWHCCFGYLL